MWSVRKVVFFGIDSQWNKIYDSQWSSEMLKYSISWSLWCSCLHIDLVKIYYPIYLWSFPCSLLWYTPVKLLFIRKWKWKYKPGRTILKNKKNNSRSVVFAMGIQFVCLFFSNSPVRPLIFMISECVFLGNI